MTTKPDDDKGLNRKLMRIKTSDEALELGKLLSYKEIEAVVQVVEAHIDKKVNEVLDRVEAEAGWYSQQFNDQARKDNIEDTLIRLSSIKKLRSEL
jgi:hypothetical protein